MSNGGGAVGCGEFDSQRGKSALIYAAMNGHADSMRMLIDVGADKEVKDEVRVGLC